MKKNSAEINLNESSRLYGWKWSLTFLESVPSVGDGAVIFSWYEIYAKNVNSKPHINISGFKALGNNTCFCYNKQITHYKHTILYFLR